VSGGCKYCYSPLTGLIALLHIHQLYLRGHLEAKEREEERGRKGGQGKEGKGLEKTLGNTFLVMSVCKQWRIHRSSV